MSEDVVAAEGEEARPRRWVRPLVLCAIWWLGLVVLAFSPVKRAVNLRQLESADSVVIAQYNKVFDVWTTNEHMTFKGTKPEKPVRLPPEFRPFSKGNAILPLSETDDGWVVTQTPEGTRPIYPTKQIRVVAKAIGFTGYGLGEEQDGAPPGTPPPTEADGG